jgi:hypothetical protein
MIITDPKSLEPKNDSPRSSAISVKWLDFICFGLLFFNLSISVNGASELADSPKYFWPSIVHACLTFISIIASGWLLWARRETTKHTIIEICFVLVLSNALSDTSKFWFDPTARNSISPYWFMAACYAFILIINDYASRRPVLSKS